VQVHDHGLQRQRLELLGVPELLAHRVGPRRVQVQDRKIELVGPPVRVAFTPGGSVPMRRAVDAHDRTPRFGLQIGLRQFGFQIG
jgi:hypothetical protein